MKIESSSFSLIDIKVYTFLSAKMNTFYMYGNKIALDVCVQVHDIPLHLHYHKKIKYLVILAIRDTISFPFHCRL